MQLDKAIYEIITGILKEITDMSMLAMVLEMLQFGIYINFSSCKISDTFGLLTTCCQVQWTVCFLSGKSHLMWKGAIF